MPRLRRADSASPGFARKRHGRGFSYLDERGRALRDSETLERIRSLAIPPAWRDVWICPDPLGHLQAVGTDARDRRQYLYHPQWRAKRDRQKFDEMLDFARLLPDLRAQVATRLGSDGLTMDRVVACALRLLDRGFFRLGGEAYADENGSHGVATLEKRHVTLEPEGVVIFDYRGKSGKRHVQRVIDPDVHRIARELKARRGAGSVFLAYKNVRWTPVRSNDVNTAIKSLTAPAFSAKDFRTWHATVLAAMAVGVAATAATERARTRAVNRAVCEVAGYLGNTPAVCRASYIDPRIFDRYRAGQTIAPAIEGLNWADAQDQPVTHGAIEDAVLELLAD